MIYYYRLINKLNSAQANAISINNQRIVYDSYLHLKDDKLYLNDIAINEPFIIKAIGDSETLAVCTSESNMESYGK